MSNDPYAPPAQAEPPLEAEPREGRRRWVQWLLVGALVVLAMFLFTIAAYNGWQASYHASAREVSSRYMKAFYLWGVLGVGSLVSAVGIPVFGKLFASRRGPRPPEQSQLVAAPGSAIRAR